MELLGDQIRLDMIKRTDQILTYFIAGVWFVNGLICKILNWVPRHQEIVGAILGDEHAYLLTKMIGVGEIGIGVWVLSGMYRRFNAIVQIALVMVMNILEYILVPEMLLWGKMNFVFASLFSIVIFWKEFILGRNQE